MLCQTQKSGTKVKVGFPRYKKFVSSLTYPQGNGFRVEKKKVFLSKIGNVNFVNHREMEGTAKTCTIKKTKSGEWYLTFSSELEITRPFTNGKEAIGIDLGISNYVTMSNGTVLNNIAISEREKSRMKRLQRAISRREKGSQKRRKAIFRFAKKYEHILRMKENHLHKLSYDLVNSYSFIAHENLNIQGMMKNHHLAKSIGESSWGNLIQLLQYKAESAGCVVVGTNPRNTSKTCSECGNIQDMPLSERTYECSKCCMSKDRDLNAAINMLNRAREGHSRSNASGDGVRPQLREAVVVERGTTFGGAS